MFHGDTSISSIVSATQGKPPCLNVARCLATGVPLVRRREMADGMMQCRDRRNRVRSARFDNTRVEDIPRFETEMAVA